MNEEKNNQHPRGKQPSHQLCDDPLSVALEAECTAWKEPHPAAPAPKYHPTPQLVGLSASDA